MKSHYATISMSSHAKYDLKKVHVAWCPKPCSSRYRAHHNISRSSSWLKGTSSRVLLQEFPHLKKQYWGRHLWARGKLRRDIEARLLTR